MRKKGISLIVLVITIVVIIILAAAVILSMGSNNPVESSKKAKVLSSIASFKEELDITISSKLANNLGIDLSEIDATGNEILEYISSIEEQQIGSANYIDILEIKNGKLVINETSQSWNLLQPKEKSYVREALTGVDESSQSLKEKIGAIINESEDIAYLKSRLEETGENVYIVKWDKYIIFDLNNNIEYRVLFDGTVENCGNSTLGTILKNTKTADAEQLSWDSTTSNIIGLDDKGNTVNMLRWEYSVFTKEHEDATVGLVGRYGLNDSHSLYCGGVDRSAGYIESYTLNEVEISNYNEDGSIKGTVPAYISVDGGNTFSSVISMGQTFYSCEKVVIAPEIPNTITNLNVCFYQSANLVTPPSKISNYARSQMWSYAGCSSLQAMPEMSKYAKNLQGAFDGCISLKTAKTLPENVENITTMFSGCTKLEGIVKIDGALTNWKDCFRNNAGSEGSGIIISKDSKCPKEILDKIVESSSYVSMEE